MRRRTAEIVSIEYCLPDKVETNQELSALFPEWDLDSLSRKTGVYQRHIAAPDECASDLAYRACLRLFQTAAVARSEIDALIVCTQSPDYQMPPNATLLQHRLGLPKSVAAFDYSLACSGYVYGLVLCKALIESGLMNTIILITCDTYSKYIRANDRGTRTLFGDGAAATLVRRGTAGICHVSLATDGSGAEKFIIKSGGCRGASGIRAEAGPASDDKYIQMDGFGVLSFVKREIPPFTENLLRKARLTRDQIDLFIFHQASKISLDQVSGILGIPKRKTVINFENIGNTVSSSIPIAIKMGWEAGVLMPGMVTMLLGFGVGFSWGGAIVRWTDNFQDGSP
jgi:3-oxoacyl-[acyl-carrier-protein] synthase-3